jgi:hypothetical protein
VSLAPGPPVEACLTSEDQLTESPTADAPSGNPLDLLPLRQLVVSWFALTRGRSRTSRTGSQRERTHSTLGARNFLGLPPH